MTTDPGAPGTMTFDEFMGLPEEGFFELIDGVLHVTPSGTWRHQTIITNLIVAFRLHLREQPVGAVVPAPMDVILRREHPARVVQPDLIFVSRERSALIGARSVNGAPDLVVEVLSASNQRHDMVLKRHWYEKYGVSEYWMVLNDGDQVEVLRRGADGTFGHPALFEAGMVLETPLLPGFKLDVGLVFEGTEPR